MYIFICLFLIKSPNGGTVESICPDSEEGAKTSMSRENVESVDPTLPLRQCGDRRTVRWNNHLQTRLNKRGSGHRTARTGGFRAARFTRLPPLPPQKDFSSALQNCFASSEQQYKTQIKMYIYVKKQTFCTRKSKLQ